MRIMLSTLLGQQVRDIEGRISNETGELVFKLYAVQLEDYTWLYCEGEHDFPYLTGIDQDILEQVTDKEG